MEDLVSQMRESAEERLVAAVVAGDGVAFGELTERYRRELRVHAYRMLGSYDDAEDIVQETFMRAWRRRETYQSRSTIRAWLYKIATNACLDFLASTSRRARPYESEPLVASSSTAPTPLNVPWLQPYPDTLLEPASPRDDEPDAVSIARETIELAFLVTIQLLPPRQRAVLILRDVLGWPATETASLLDTSVPSVKSALQRARATIRDHLPESRDEWTATQPTSDEQAVLRRYVKAHERGDLDAIAELLARDIQQTMPPLPEWLVGRDALNELTAAVYDPSSPWFHGQWRLVPTAANRQLAVASYVSKPSAAETEGLAGEYRAQGLDVLRIVDGTVAAITTFEPKHFERFGLPLVLP